MTGNPQSQKPRRSVRVAMRVPIEVKGSLPDSTVHEESTHTGIVGVHGATIHMSLLLPVNAEIEVTNPFSRQTAKFRIVSIGPQTPSGLWEIGIEAFQTLDDFWGVRFSPKPVDP